MNKQQSEWLDQIRLALSKPLPAAKAHITAAPGERVEGLISRVWPRDAKQSAVTFLLFPEKGEWHTLFMKRVVYNGVHSGQISLPGGQVELADEDLLHTALREFDEETGVALTKSDYLGALSDLYIPPSNFIVQPYIAFLPVLPQLQPELAEVQELHKIALVDLFNPDNFTKEEIVIRQRGEKSYTIKAPCYKIKKLCIWGATAMMISELEWVFNKYEIPTLL